MPQAEISGLTLHYETAGDGLPVLLIAGIPAIANDWEPMTRGLAAAGHQVIAYDNRGSGQSTVTPGPYTTRQLADDAIALLDDLGIARADVFGMSLGGMIAQEFAPTPCARRARSASPSRCRPMTGRRGCAPWLRSRSPATSTRRCSRASSPRSPATCRIPSATRRRSRRCSATTAPIDWARSPPRRS